MYAGWMESVRSRNLEFDYADMDTCRSASLYNVPLSEAILFFSARPRSGAPLSRDLEEPLYKF